MAKINPIPPYLTPQDIARFWAKVNKDGPIVRPELGPCWIWTGGTYSDGYGAFHIGTRKTVRRKCRASRIAHFLATGKWPLLDVCHRCDNPPCCREEHLFEGTEKMNVADARAKGRLRVGADNPQAKLDDKSVREMRALHAAGHSRIEIAKQFDVRVPTVRRVVKHLNWTHIP